MSAAISLKMSNVMSKVPSLLRLVQDDDDTSPLGRIGFEPVGAERRVFPRRETQGQVQGKRMDHTVTARREPHLSLLLRDVSIGGMAAISSTPVQAGERISVSFPRQGMQSGWDAFGRVIRCDAGHFGYRIAVEFDPIPLAA